MTRKVIAVGLIVLIFLLGIIAINLAGFALGFMAHLEGYNGCQSSIKLPYILTFILAEIGMLTIITSLWVYSLFFKLNKTVIKRLVILYVINLSVMAYLIFSYPLLEKVSAADWGGSRTNSSALINPLLYISILSSLILILLIRRHQMVLNNPRLETSIYYLVTGLSTLESIVVLTTPVEACVI